MSKKGRIDVRQDPSTVDLGYGNQVPEEARMVKKFRRSAAGLDEQLPSDLRPPHILQKTVDYLLGDIIDNAHSLASVHHFIWDRTRAIRNDFSIQQVTKLADVRIAMDCYERIARFHILSLHQMAIPGRPDASYDYFQDKQQLDKTLFSLMQLYDDSKEKYRSSHEPEFRAYCVLMAIQNYDPYLEDKIQNWPSQVLTSELLKRALRLYQAAGDVIDPHGPLKPQQNLLIARQNWERFWKIVGSSELSYLLSCCAEMVFNNVRKTALHTLWSGFRAGKSNVQDFTSDVLMDVLAFDAENDVYEFCEHYGFSFVEPNDGMPYLDLNSLQSWQGASPGLTPQYFSNNLVERKRCGRTLAAVLGGMNVIRAQQAGLIRYDEDLDTGLANGDEDPESLFVPDIKSSQQALNGAAPSFTPPSAVVKNPFATSSVNPSLGAFGEPKKPVNPFAVQPPPVAQPAAQTAAPIPSNPFTTSATGSTQSNPFGVKPIGDPTPLFAGGNASATAPSMLAPLNTASTDEAATASPAVNPFPTADSSARNPFTQLAPNEDSSTVNQPRNSGADRSKLFDSANKPLFASAAIGTSGHKEEPKASPLEASSPPFFKPPSIFSLPASESIAASTLAPFNFSSQPTAQSNAPSVSSGLNATSEAEEPTIVITPANSASLNTDKTKTLGTNPIVFTPTDLNSSTSATANVQEASKNPVVSGTATSRQFDFLKAASPMQNQPSDTRSTPQSFLVAPPTASSSFSSLTQPPKPATSTQPAANAPSSGATLLSAGATEVQPNLSDPASHVPLSSIARPTADVQRSSQNLPKQPPQISWKQRKQNYLTRLAEDLFNEPETGLHKQLVDYLAGSIVAFELKRFKQKERQERIALLRYNTIARKWGRVWSDIARVLRLRRQGRERRARVLAEREARAERRSELSSSVGSSQDLDKFKRSLDQNHRISNGGNSQQEERELDQSEVKGRGAGVPRIAKSSFRTTNARTSIRAKHRRSYTQPANSITNTTPQNSTYRVSKPSSAPKQSLRHTALTASMQAAAALPFSDSLFGDSVLPTGTRVGTMKNSYFKLKAMGVNLDSDEEDVPDITRGAGSKKRAYDHTGETPAIAAKRRISPNEQFSSTSVLDRYRHLLDRGRGADVVTAKAATPANKRVATGISTEDDELFARLRKVKETLAESEDWFKTAREREEDRQRSRSSSAELRNSVGSNTGAPSSVPGHQLYHSPIDIHRTSLNSLTRHTPAGSPPRSLPKFWGRESFFVKREDYGKTKAQREQDRKAREAHVLQEPSREGRKENVDHLEEETTGAHAVQVGEEEQRNHLQLADEKKRLTNAAADALERKGEGAFVREEKAPATAAIPNPFANSNGPVKAFDVSTPSTAKSHPFAFSQLTKPSSFDDSSAIATSQFGQSNFAQPTFAELPTNGIRNGEHEGHKAESPDEESPHGEEEPMLKEVESYDQATEDSDEQVESFYDEADASDEGYDGLDEVEEDFGEDGKGFDEMGEYEEDYPGEMYREESAESLPGRHELQMGGNSIEDAIEL